MHMAVETNSLTAAYIGLATSRYQDQSVYYVLKVRIFEAVFLGEDARNYLGHIVN